MLVKEAPCYCCSFDLKGIWCHTFRRRMKHHEPTTVRSRCIAVIFFCIIHERPPTAPPPPTHPPTHPHPHPHPPHPTPPHPPVARPWGKGVECHSKVQVRATFYHCDCCAVCIIASYTTAIYQQSIVQWYFRMDMLHGKGSGAKLCNIDKQQ